MTTLIALFTAAAVVQLVSWIVIAAGSDRALRRRDGSRDSVLPPVSVVVAVRNGAESLPALFGASEPQASDGDEIIVVDDHSEDATVERVLAAASRNPRIRLVTSAKRGKKAALTAGVRAASNDVLALTDADCVPAEKWLSEIRRMHRGHDSCVVVGYGPYAKRKGLLNLLVRYETLHTALLSITAIALGRPYMAVGRNLSYEKQTFERLGGFEQSADLLSGDDDLFLQSAVDEGVPVHFMADPSSFVYSEAPRTFREWLRQKRRHLSTGRRYRLAAKIGLFAYHTSALLCWIAPLAVGWAGVACLLSRLVPGQIVAARTAPLLKEDRLASRFVPLDLAYQLYLIAVAPIAWFRPPKRW